MGSVPRLIAAPYTAAMHLPSCPAAVPHPDWLRPDWPAPAHIHALCTSRAGGVSAAPFDSLNLGDHVGDAPAAVTANRQILQAALQRITPGTQPVFLQQVHGTQVLELQEGQEGHGALSSNFSANFCFDACATSAARTACTIMVADCLPVLLTNRQGSVVAAAHAGWRGLAGKDGKGVLEAVFKHFEAFEVGAEVRAAFCAHDSAAAVHFVPHGAGKYLADLAGLARQRLHALGITHIYGNDSSAGWCTASNPSRFFSHRRDSAALDGSGRFAVCIWRSG